MFGSKKAKISSEIDSLVGGNTTIKGDVFFTGGLHIDGVVKGNVVAESEQSLLTTSDRGRIEGNVKVHSIVLNGEVVGDVHAYKHIELAANARVTGNVYYQVIEMAMGAEVNGSLIHLSKEQSAAQQAEQEVSQSAEPADQTEAIAEPVTEETTVEATSEDTDDQAQSGYASNSYSASHDSGADDTDSDSQAYQYSVK